MSCYDKIISDLKRTKLYNLTPKSKTESDLYVCARYIDFFENEINNLFNSCLAADISNVSYTKFCRLFSLPERLSLSNLNKIVLKRMAITNQDFTKAGIQKCLEALGFKAILTESLATGVVKITIHEDMGLYATNEEKEAQIKSCLPCHVIPIFVWNV